MVAEEGVPGREGLGMGTVEPVFFLCPPLPPLLLVHMVVLCVWCICVCACIQSVCRGGGGVMGWGAAYELQLQCEQQQCQFYL